MSDRETMKTKKLLTVFGVLLLADGLLLATSTFTAPARVVQIPLYASVGALMYRDNPERFHRRVGRAVIFWTIFGTLAAFAAFVVLGLAIH